MKKLFSITLALGALTACQPQAPSLDILGPVPELGHGLMEGYLQGEPPLNSAAFVPPPPTTGSARQQADDAASEALRSLEGLLAGIRPPATRTSTSLPQLRSLPAPWAPM